MAYTLNGYYKLSFSNPHAPRIIIYPNNETAANLLNYHKGKQAAVVEVADCVPDNATRLPMPNAIMSLIDSKIKAAGGRAVVVGIDAYLSLLTAEGVTEFMAALRKRIDDHSSNADYLLSERNMPRLVPRYEESLSIIVISGIEECLDPPNIEAYSDKWVKSRAVVGYKGLLKQLGRYVPTGKHTFVLEGLCNAQTEIGSSVSFILDAKDIAQRHYGIDTALDNAVLDVLLTQSVTKGQTPELYLENLFGKEKTNTRFALKRLLELPEDDLWSAHIWRLRKLLPGNSYISNVILDDVTRDDLLRRYAVDYAVTAISDINAQQYAIERAEALKELGTDYESLIVEFIGQVRDSKDALPFLNCGTDAERVEIIRRASLEDLTHDLPRKYTELFPTLVDYFNTAYDYGDSELNSYFKEYRRLRLSDSITDEFVQLAYNLFKQKTFSTRDKELAELRTDPDTALLVVDALGAEYMPLLLALAKRRGMNIESKNIVSANLPTETAFNPIEWDESRTLPEIRSVDNIVHYGAAKHEVCTSERNFAETLRVFETNIMNEVAKGLTSFSRVVLTADHGASKLAVIAHREKKSKTLPWDKQKYGKPDDWRYSLAPQGFERPSEFESAYFPETGRTYWIVRGYNRLPKEGGKLYELHGGASLEELLVPIVVFTRNNVATTPTPIEKNKTAEIVDELEGLI